MSKQSEAAWIKVQGQLAEAIKQNPHLARQSRLNTSQGSRLLRFAG